MSATSSQLRSARIYRSLPPFQPTYPTKPTHSSIMTTKKDMRRADLSRLNVKEKPLICPSTNARAVIPYQEPTAKDSSGDMTSTLSSTLPMAAMFTRNKYIGWGSVVFAVQGWLSESAETRKNASQPAYFSVGMACKSSEGLIPLFVVSTDHPFI